MEIAREIINEYKTRRQEILSEYESKKILDSYGIPITKERLVNNLEEAKGFIEREIHYPLVLKVNAPGLIHKTELGLVKVGIKSFEELEDAFSVLGEKAKTHSGNILIQEMVDSPREFVSGYINDEYFGPSVMFGLGGIFAEALDDTAFRVAPVDGSSAKEMCFEIKGAKILGEFRGLSHANVTEISKLIRKLGGIGMDNPEIKAIDVNPLMIDDQGQPVVVDASVVLGKVSHLEELSTQTVLPDWTERFFSPRSVAIIGASSKRHKAGNDVIRNILDNGYEGEIYFVNPKGGTIFGRDVYTSVADLPKEIDLAIIILPAEHNIKTIEDCADHGIKCFVLAAGGFSEVDEKGEKLQNELVNLVKEKGIKILGPNTSGHTSTPHKFTSSFFPLGKIPRGNISYVAQTGNFATHTMRYIITSENFGVSRVVGLGNKVDIDECDVLEYYWHDPETKAIFAYLESLKRPRHFLELAEKITKDKPIILLKGGRSASGAGAAVAHTAAMATNDRILDGALKQAGVVRIYKYSHLILVAKALAMMPLPKGRRVSFLAPSGAMLVTLTDLCEKDLNLGVPSLEEKTRKRLQEISPSYIRMRNPVDIWPSATIHGVEYAYREGMKAVLEDENIDAVVPILMLTDETGIPSYDFIVDLAKEFPEKPIYVTFSAEKKHMEAAKAYLESRGVPTFPLIEDPFEVLSIVANCRSRGQS